MAPAVLLNTPTPGPQGGTPVIKTENTADNRDERLRTTLREAVTRFNNELMDDEERMVLLDRVRRIRHRLGL
jgi:hypothetical protein